MYHFYTQGGKKVVLMLEIKKKKKKIPFQGHKAGHWSAVCAAAGLPWAITALRFHPELFLRHMVEYNLILVTARR